MLRISLRLLLASLVLTAIGWSMSITYAVVEAIRVAAMGCLALGLLLLLINYVRTPEPRDG